MFFFLHLLFRFGRLRFIWRIILFSSLFGVFQPVNTKDPPQALQRS
jgi:hypothetical protein